jgi:hypothetical protein
MAKQEEGRNGDGSAPGSIWTSCNCSGRIISKLAANSWRCDAWRASMHLDGTTTCRAGNFREGK